MVIVRSDEAYQTAWRLFCDANPSIRLIENVLVRWLLLDDSEVIGTIAIAPWGPMGVEVKDVYVRPDYRSRGYGRALMRTVMRYGRNNNKSFIYLRSGALMYPFRHLVEELGFDEINPGMGQKEISYQLDL